MKRYIVLVLLAISGESSSAPKSLPEYVSPADKSLFDQWLGQLEETDRDLRESISEGNVLLSVTVLGSRLIPANDELRALREPLRSAVTRSMIVVEVASQLGLIESVPRSFFVTLGYFSARGGVFSRESSRVMTILMVLPRSKVVWASLKSIAAETEDRAISVVSLAEAVAKLAFRVKPQWYTKMFSLVEDL